MYDRTSSHPARVRRAQLFLFHGYYFTFRLCLQLRAGFYANGPQPSPRAALNFPANYYTYATDAETEKGRE